MSNLSRKLMMGAAGSGGEVLGVEDVFSTRLYAGNNTTQTITNGIDLAGEGGLVWIKSRNNTFTHDLADTARGGLNRLSTNINAAQAIGFSDIAGFTSSGFNLTVTAGSGNSLGTNYASWTFRKAPKFFDVVTYTGDGSSLRAINHSLGSVPGCILIKSTSALGNWRVYHRSLGVSQQIVLNATDPAASSGALFGNPATAPTSSSFYVGNDSESNGIGATYVAYLFAHDAGGFGDSGDESVVKCGSFTTDGSAAATVDLGWEPQWLLTKATNTTGNWILWDTMRGMPVTTGPQYLLPNLSNAEVTGGATMSATATGFYTQGMLGVSNTIAYIAIRRGPMKTPTDATEVFAADIETSPTYSKTFTSGFPVDLAIETGQSTTGSKWWFDRIRGKDAFNLQSNATSSETSYNGCAFDLQTTWREDIGTGNSNAIAYMFRRAPGFFDVVAWTEDGNTTKNHNLGVAPELAIVKARSSTSNWVVDVVATNNRGVLNSSSSFDSGLAFSPYTSTTFNGGGGTAGITKIAYLFATLAGVSKVGSYTGNGSSQTINCGFTSGARFILIKNASRSSTFWFVYDTARGIVSGNDPFLLLNTSDAEDSSTDYVDPDSSGFIVNGSTDQINRSGDTYIFYAIA